MRFLITSQFEPTVCQARFLRYLVSSVLGHGLNLLGSRDVIANVTTGLAIWGFLYRCSI